MQLGAAGCNVDLEMQNGRTALEVAEAQGHAIAPLIPNCKLLHTQHCGTAVVVQRRVSAAPPPPCHDCDCDTPLLGRCSQEDCDTPLLGRCSQEDSDTALLDTVACVASSRLRPKAELNARALSSTSMTVRLEEEDSGQVKEHDEP
jgi:ankyrin repeat protein